MKQSILKISKNSVILKDLKTSKAKDADGLDIFKEKMQQMWNMYEEQLQRNFDLMQIINRQQVVIQQITSPSPLSLPLVEQEITISKSANQEATREEELNFEPLHYKKLNELSTLLKELNIVKRTDAANSIVNFLYVLRELGGSAPAKQIFHAAGIADITGFRYIADLAEIGFILHSGMSYKLKYTLTEKGKQFLDGKIKNILDLTRTQPEN